MNILPGCVPDDLALFCFKLTIDLIMQFLK
jgi:hypothetical protein